MKLHSYAVIVASIFVGAAQASTLTGRIYSDQGGPVVGALAIVQQTIATPNYSTYRVVTDIHGKFTLTVPDSRTYSVCVGAWSARLLNSCEWSFAQNLVTIPPGQSAASITITLRTGAILPIRLDDPQTLLPSAVSLQSVSLPLPSSPPSPTVRFGVWSSEGQYHPAIHVSSDSAGRNYQILLPLAASVQFSAQATGVQIVDQAGKVFGGAPSVAFQVVPSAVLQGLHYAVSSAAK